jgi:diacylglycerol O-acyltransferase / wax synthase
MRVTTEEISPAWGAATDMNAFESVMWKLDANPRMRAGTMGLEQLDRVPDWDRFFAAHEWAVRMAPRFRQKVVEPILGVGNARWAEDPAFDLRYHLRHQRLPKSGGWLELMEAAGQFFTTPLDRSRAPWQSTLYEGLPGGKAVYAIKMHHSVTDGMGVMQLLSRLHSRTREPTLEKPQPSFDAGDPLDPLGALLRQARSDVGALPSAARDVASGALRVIRNPVGSARSAIRYGRSATRVLNPDVGGGSPLLAQRCMTLGLAAIDVPYADFKSAAKVAGGSTNDAYLAALTGGFRRYHEAMQAPIPDAMPISIPLSVRAPDDPEGGNQIVTVRFAAPLKEPDPCVRIAQIRELISSIRTEPAMNVLEVLSPAIARLPGPVVAQLVSSITRNNDIMASNVPGLVGDYYLAGAKIERFYGYGLLGGGATMVSFITHGEVGCLGVGYDAAAVTEPALFVESLVAGIAEVLDLHPGAARPQLRA